MKFRMLFLGLFSLSAIAPLGALTANPAAAVACVGVDVSNQIALHGSRDGVSQSQSSTMEAAPGCFGSTSVNVGNQVYTGPGDGLVQEQESYHYLDGVNNPTPYGDEYLPTEGDDIYIPVHTQTDIYVPAYDPEFYDSYLGVPVPTDQMYAYN
jgi:hypothetical protein